MSQKVYIDQIFTLIMKLSIDAHHDFVLRKDSDLDHKLEKFNIAHTWKETDGLEFYFNYHSLPNIALIENCWQPVKLHLYKYSH